MHNTKLRNQKILLNLHYILCSVPSKKHLNLKFLNGFSYKYANLKILGYL